MANARWFRLIMMAALTAMAAWCADVTGKWKATVTGPDGNSMDVVLNFKQDGQTLTGTVGSSSQGDRGIVDGKVEGEKVSFAVERSSGKLRLTGTVSGDDMKLVADLGDRKIDINAKREAGAAAK